jgi:hypothetical protein
MRFKMEMITLIVVGGVAAWALIWAYKLDERNAVLERRSLLMENRVNLLTFLVSNKANEKGKQDG